MKRSAATILSVVFLLSSMIATIVTPVSAPPVEPAGTYTAINGVLSSDYYVLYPYTAGSVNVGFSKYGELIGLPAGADPSVQANWVGLQYGAVDAFCPSAGIPMNEWINGWYVDIEYTDPVWSGVKRDRHVWAFAMFADGLGYDGDWTYAAKIGDAPGHGRQTNGICETEPLQVLYDGPREFIAMSVTHISDFEGTFVWPVVDIAITLRFDKVMKQVVLYKDVKLMCPKLHLSGKLDVQLSNREEYDLGTSSLFDSYAHYYRMAGETCYGPNWHMAEKLLRENVSLFVGNGVQREFVIPCDMPLAKDFIKVYVDGVFVDPTAYTIDWNAKKITFLVAPSIGVPPGNIEVRYKFEFANAVDWNQKYDIAQMISNDGVTVAWAGLWPPVSDWTVDGALRYLKPLVMVSESDCVPEPKESPILIGEWDFLMDDMDVPQFRAVEVKGITNRHDAQDSDHGDGNVIDREAMYQLDSVFKPWGLYDAVEKQTERWVEWKSAGASSYTTHVRPGLLVPTALWDQYGVFSERVIRMDTGKLLNRWWGEYSVTLNAQGYLVFSGLPSAKCKILYSTKAVDSIVVLIGDAPAHSAPSGSGLFTDAYGGDPGRDEAMLTTDDLDYATVVSDVAGKGITVLGVNYNPESTSAAANFAYITGKTAGAVYSGSTKWNETIANTVQNILSKGKGVDVVFIVDLSGSMGGSTLTDVQSKIANIVDLLASGDVKFGVGSFVDYPGAYNSYGYAATYGTSATGDYAFKVDKDLTEDGVLAKSIVAGLTAKYGGDGPQDYTRALYESMFFDWRRLGRYEWVEVGRDAAAVDNTGAALVAEAFDSYKQIGIGISGNDMFNSELPNQCPRIMAKFGAGTDTLSNYKDALLRAALADDWCTYWPVASSNMIGVGGPLANLQAYYANDFEDAFYGLAPFAGTGPYDGKITGIPCWNRGWDGTWNVYSSFTSSSVGYAVISTTLDINGTEMFNVWGHFGRDTYYACQWLHGDEARMYLDPNVVVGSPGIKELQLAPCGLTSIVLRISYGTDPSHPFFSVVECEGTISETLWYCWGNGGYDVTTPYKGGIHDP